MEQAALKQSEADRLRSEVAVLRAEKEQWTVSGLLMTYYGHGGDQDDREWHTDRTEYRESLTIRFPHCPSRAYSPDPAD